MVRIAPLTKGLLTSVALSGLVACSGDGNLRDFDLRGLGGGFDTTSALDNTAPRPEPDERGVISYDTHDVVIARRGETVRQIATRLGLDTDLVARHNGVNPDTPMRRGEVVTLPMRLPRADGTSTTIQPPADIAVTPLSSAPEPAEPAGGSGGTVLHQVQRGETIYSIARLYNVPVRSLAEWNGIGPDLAVREGQQLTIPSIRVSEPAQTTVTAPGQGSVTPTPPSASSPLPADDAPAASTPDPDPVPAPNIGQTTATPATSAPFVMPVSGSIIRDYNPGRNEGIDISVASGTTVRAAAAGTVAAITENTNGAKIIVIRHTGNILTVYVNVDNLSVAKDDNVTQGQSIAKVASGEPSFLHFEVRDGLNSVDPGDYLPI